MTILGTSGDDSLTGTAGDDTIDGLDGRDTLSGGDGNDVIYDGAGNYDLVNGGGGNDTIYGGGGQQDTLYGDAGNDVIYDGAGDADVIWGDNLFDNGNDTIYGGAGNDAHYGGYGSDLFVFDPGDGIDTVSSPNIPSDVDVIEIAGGLTIADIRFQHYVVPGFPTQNFLIIHYGTGGDQVWISTHFSAEENPNLYQVSSLVVGGTTVNLTGGLPFTGTAGADTVRGSIHDDTLSGLGGNDSLEAYAGNDVLYGGDGTDTLSGGDGNDVLYDGSGDHDVVYGGAGSDTIYGGDGHVDSLYGGDGNDVIYDGAGDYDTVEGGDGNDTIYGGAGNDWHTGIYGNDRFVFDLGDGQDTVSSPNRSIDTNVIEIAGGLTTADIRFEHYVVPGYPSQNFLIIHYGTGGDQVRISSHFNAETNPTSYYQTASLVVGGTTIDLRGALPFTGTSGADIVRASMHNDTMSGLAGDDTMLAGDGHDLVYGGDGADSMDGGAGSDSLEGGAGNDTILGGVRWDTLLGGDGNDVLDGGTENDRMYGGAGNDTYYADNSGDRALENAGEGTDIVYASVDFALWDDVEHLILTGTAATGTGNSLSNAITGNASANTLSGGNGNDTLTGGAGNDSLTGGGHSDDFVFAAAASNGTDVITDFVHGTDRLVFTGADYGFSTGHTLTAAQFTAGSSASGSGAQFIWDAATGHLYWDADGTGSGAAVDLALIGIGVTVTKDDLAFS